ncbi:MAG: dihydroxyacetone kinase phosphoryl donor subunit DhaM [Candidatus Baltobacteraceae bacterium]|jgi:phosphocarrier protein FPr
MAENVAVLVVSHSAKLAQGVRELALQMARGSDLVWAVGGADDGQIGTSAPAIKRALEEALGSAPAVVVLLDLGSAHLNTVMAIEMLAPDLQPRVTMADAPLVEGAILAVVAAASGFPADEVRARAEEASAMHKLL